MIQSTETDIACRPVAVWKVTLQIENLDGGPGVLGVSVWEADYSFSNLFEFVRFCNRLLY